MKNDQNGFGTLGTIAVIVIILVMSAISWRVLDKTKTSTAITSQSSQVKPLVLAASNLPRGWVSDPAFSDSGILVSNGETKCTANAIYTTDTAESNSAEVDQNKQTVDAIKSKGYTVEETPGKLKINTASGQKEIYSQNLAITGQDNPTFQIYAYVTKPESYTRIQLSCPNEADLPSAKIALSAFKFTKL